MIERIDAVLLAGAPAGSDMCPENPSLSRAMVELVGKPMLQWVVDALCASPSVDRIVAVGHVKASGLDDVIEPGGSMVDNIKRGIDAVGSDKPVLVVSADIPLLTVGSVEDFIKRARQVDADLVVPILPRAHCEKRYPQFKRTYAKTADGVFTLGNLMLVKPKFIANNWQAVSAAYDARKQVWRLARMIGIGVLARLVVAQVIPAALPVSVLERAVSKMLDAPVAAVVSAHPEIGEDVDKPSDLEAVRDILTGSSGGTALV